MLGLGLGFGLPFVGMGGGGAPVTSFDPTTMFVGGKPGIYHKTADMSSLFLDRSMTPVTPAVVDGLVGTRKDLSGNGNHQIAPSDAARPTLRTAAGKYWLEYDNTNDQLVGGSIDALGVNVGVLAACSALDSTISVILAKSAGGSPYVGVLQSGAATAISSPDASTYRVDGNGIASTRGAAFTAMASASGVTPHLFDAFGANVQTTTTTLMGFYAGGLGGLRRDYGIIAIKDADMGNDRYKLYEFFAGLMGKSDIGFVIGDSTIAQYFANNPVTYYISTSQYVINAAVVGENIAQQQARWVDFTLKPNATWVIIEVGLNDLDPTTEPLAAPAIARLQALVTLVRAGIPVTSKILIGTLTPCKSRLAALYGASPGAVAYQKWLDINDAISNGGPTPITGVDARITSHTAALNDGLGNLAALYDTGDGIHENNAGRLIIGTAWDTALATLGF